MIIKNDPFWIQKAGNLPSEYEDDFFPYNYLIDIIPPNPKLKRYAIADGASTAYLSGLWARTLVEGLGLYSDEITNKNFFNLIQTLVLDKNWSPQLAEFIKNREDAGKPLSWYDEMALQNGAASTLLEISFSCDENKKIDQFSALAIGDSCLFQIRDDDLLTKFPLNSSADFDNSPLLICSNPKQNESLQEKIAYRENQSVITGDHFFLMTDALALWFFQEFEKGTKPWKIIGEMAVTTSGFREWIGELREKKLMRNDDVTLMILQIQGDEK